MSLQRKSSANITTCSSNGKEWNVVEACRGHETDPWNLFSENETFAFAWLSINYVYKFAFGFNPLWVLASWLLDVVYEYSGHMHLFLVRLLFMPSPALSIVHAASKMQRSTWEISEESNMRHKANANVNVLCGWMMVTLWRKLIPTSRHSLTHSLHIRQKVKNRAQRPCAIGKHDARCRVMCICINLRCNLSFSNFIRVFVTCFIFKKKETPLCPRSHTAEPRTGYNMMQCTQIPITRPLY